MPTAEEIKKRFTDYVMLQAYDDKYIDRQEEKKILEAAIKLGLGIEEGLALLLDIASKKGYIIERNVDNRIIEVLTQFAENDGKLDKKEFMDAVGIYKKDSHGKVPEIEIQRRIKKIVLDKGWKVKEGGLFGSKWFSDIK